MTSKSIKNNNINQLEAGITIAVSKFPDCKHGARIKSITKDPEARVVVVALLCGNCREWEAFAGFPDISEVKDECLKANDPNSSAEDYQWLCENVRDRTQVIFMGEKLPEDVARQLFPDWNKPYKGG